MGIKSGDIGIGLAGQPYRPPALSGKARIELLIVRVEAGGGAHEQGAGKTRHQHQQDQAQQGPDKKTRHYPATTPRTSLVRRASVMESKTFRILWCSCFCMYMRRSASARSFSASMPSSGQMAQPTLSESHSTPQISRPAAPASSLRQMPRASAADALSPGATMTNSSPPMRAT